MGRTGAWAAAEVNLSRELGGEGVRGHSFHVGCQRLGSHSEANPHGNGRPQVTVETLGGGGELARGGASVRLRWSSPAPSLLSGKFAAANSARTKGKTSLTYGQLGKQPPLIQVCTLAGRTFPRAGGGVHFYLEHRKSDHIFCPFISFIFGGVRLFGVLQSGRGCTSVRCMYL